MQDGDVREEKSSPLLQVLWRTNGTANGFRDGEGYPPLYGLVVLFEVALIENGSKDADAGPL